MRSVLLVLSDTHGGHKFGLCPEGIVLYDESPDGQLVPYSPELTAFQEMLLVLLLERILPAAVELAGPDPVDVFLLGDPTHGKKHIEQIMSTRLADQLEIAFQTFSLIIPRLPTLRVVRLAAGTQAHEFGEGSATLMLASRLADRYPDKDIKPLYHGLADIAGCLIDYAHHGPGPGNRVWLTGNVARFYLRDIMLSNLCAGKTPPDLVLRGHVHYPVNEVLVIGEHESRLLVCPSMCGLSDYARQVTRSAPAIAVGAALVEIVGGQALPPKMILETFDIRTKEKL